MLDKFMALLSTAKVSKVSAFQSFKVL